LVFLGFYRGQSIHHHPPTPNTTPSSIAATITITIIQLLSQDHERDKQHHIIFHCGSSRCHSMFTTCIILLTGAIFISTSIGAEVMLPSTTTTTTTTTSNTILP
jgi:hypothetical protein